MRTPSAGGYRSCARAWSEARSAGGLLWPGRRLFPGRHLLDKGGLHQRGQIAAVEDGQIQQLINDVETRIDQIGRRNPGDGWGRRLDEVAATPVWDPGCDAGRDPTRAFSRGR
jgi:hypothetical protein